ncbi:MAG: phosphate acyltransferase PlsX [Halioglobus sp.]
MPQKTVNLAVDTMSGDFGLRVTIPAALQSIKKNPKLFLHLIGDQSEIADALGAWSDEERSRVSMFHAPDVVAENFESTELISTSKATSMRAALDMLRRGEVEAVVSAGNSIALMILALKVLGTVEATRPAFCSMFPTSLGSAAMLDLGANVDCSPEQLLTFALLGSVLFSTLHSSKSPRVALLSNGTEAKKGNAQIRSAAVLLQDSPQINYVGYVEANNLHQTDANVVVCDGFTGNIALKAVEGTAKLSSESLSKVLQDAAELNLSDEQQENLIAAFASAMNPELHNGAFLLGLDSLVVKAHGASSIAGFAASIDQALQCEQDNMIARVKRELAATNP